MLNQFIRVCRYYFPNEGTNREIFKCTFPPFKASSGFVNELHLENNHTIVYSHIMYIHVNNLYMFIYVLYTYNALTNI